MMMIVHGSFPFEYLQCSLRSADSKLLETSTMLLHAGTFINNANAMTIAKGKVEKRIDGVLPVSLRNMLSRIPQV